MLITALLVGLCCFYCASGGTHSMKYTLTGVTDISGFPMYTAVGLVDDIPFVYYDSNIKKMIPKTSWIKENMDADYWDRESQREAGWEAIFAVNVQTLMQRFNQSTGVHTVQLMCGCTLNDDDTMKGYFQYGYDGEDFLSLDKSSLTWTAASPQAVITKNKWDSTGADARIQTNYLENTCIEWLKKYVVYGQETLERKVAPEVSLLQQKAGVVCHATGFYPEGVMITWKRDGVEMQDDVDVAETLPNNDGTFQKRAVLTVSPEERENGLFTCEVAHKSGETIVKTLTHDNPIGIGIIIGCVIAALVLIGVIVGVVIKRKKGYKKAEQSDSDSDNSNPIVRT